MKITKDVVVSIAYTLKGDDGVVIDTSEGGEPLSYLHGHANIIDGLETELEGKTAGDKLKVTVSPEDGYGTRDDELVDLVPISNFAEPEELEVGGQIVAETDEGQMMFTVLEIGKDNVKLDGNHPLADQTLHFEVEIKEVRAATAEELEHGHAHGAGGHPH